MSITYIPGRHASPNESAVLLLLPAGNILSVYIGWGCGLATGRSGEPRRFFAVDVHELAGRSQPDTWRVRGENSW